MYRLSITCIYNCLFSIGKRMTILYAVCILLVTFSCQQDDYDIEYQNGNPNNLVGNWRAFEFQGGAFDLDKLSDEYDLVTALDPNSTDSLVIDNLYNSGVRVKAFYQDSSFTVSHGRQLEVINMGQYGIYAVSVTGEFQSTEEDGDFLVMNVGLYDQYASVVDTVLIWAFRKTGFEDTDFQSLLNK
ncbi:MAG: hypothetical protein JXR41_04710 [Bacteroidales bacterium]|nr:hypothetical protein [Bacteroidales bacterium]MBN2762372.1 hypothetical protein [Bacteroidales bacterium]